MNETPTEVKRTLELLNVRPSKRRGQNFLVDRGSLSKVLDFAAVTTSDNVIEVGPGLGALSEELCRRSASYTAIEIESAFAGYLRERLGERGTVIEADVREVVLGRELPDVPGGYHLVSNVPYSLSSEMTLWIIRNRAGIRRASLLFQREFAERLGASPGGKDYGSLTVLCSLFADSRLGPRIPGSCFYPSAEVESRLISFEILSSPRIDVGDEGLFEELVRASFATRRKTLLNALSASRFFGTKAEAEAHLRKENIDPGRRAETLTLEEYGRLSRSLL